MCIVHTLFSIIYSDLPLENWTDVFGFLSRSQLVQLVPHNGEVILDMNDMLGAKKTPLCPFIRAANAIIVAGKQSKPSVIVNLFHLSSSSYTNAVKSHSKKFKFIRLAMGMLAQELATMRTWSCLWPMCQYRKISKISRKSPYGMLYPIRRLSL
jgi:hypothetical protein